MAAVPYDFVGRPAQLSPDSAGLLHDLGHGLFTLSCLVDSMRLGKRFPATARLRLALISEETERLLELVRHAAHPQTDPRPVDVCGLLGSVATVATETGNASVQVLPGTRVLLDVDEVSLWRIVTNLVDNAVRAAGPEGRVELSVSGGPPVVITVTDDGPGFGQGPAGWAACGLRVAAEQAGAYGGRVRITPREPCGTRVRVEFPGSLSNAAGGDYADAGHR